MKNKLTIFSLILLTTPALVFAQSSPSFSDIPESNPDYAIVETLRSIGVFQGNPDGTFGPADQITRAEAVKVVLKTAGFPEPTAPFTTSFSDVASDAWYAGYISQAEQLSIIQGNPDGTFNPSGTINRAEFLKMLLTASNEEFASANIGTLEAPVATDVAPSDWFAPYLSYAKDLNIISFNLQNQLSPGQLMTREECAEIIYKLYILRNGADKNSLLSLADNHMNEVPTLLNEVSPDLNAVYAHADEGVFYSGLLLKLNASSDVFKGSNYLALSYKTLVNAYQIKTTGDSEGTQSLVINAEALADQAAAADNSRQAEANNIHLLGDNLLLP